MRVCALLSIAAGLSVAAFGQKSDSGPAFEIAEIKTPPKVTRPQVRGPFYTAGRYEIHYGSLLDLISIAWGLEPESIYGGPSWLEMDRFDITAKVPPGSNPETRKLMLQRMLADRFHLVTHADTKPMPGWALTVGKKVLMKEAANTEEPGGCNLSVQQSTPAAGGAIQLPIISYTCKNTTMAAFAAGILAIPTASQYLNNRPAADQTGLKDAYDFTLRITPKVPPNLLVTGTQISIFESLDKDLGLKLEAATVPVQVVVVDSADKPTPNSPDVDKSFPPPPTEFEVAEMKPSPPATPGQNQQPTVKNGRIYLPNFTLRNLIQISWNLQNPDFLINAPKWIDADHYDLIAKTPAGVALGDLTPTRNSIPVNIDALLPMLQSLLKEKFKLQVHEEERQLPAFTLTAAHPKLKAAEPGSRTRWQEGNAGDAKDKNANAAFGRMVTCQNVTMAQFAEMLPAIAPGYIRTDVADETGLKGGFDFVFSFSPVGAAQQGDGGNREGGAASNTDAAAPSGALTLQDALLKQLGLKLETTKRPMKVLVIDHLEQKPIE